MWYRSWGQVRVRPKARLEFGEMGWWELLELIPYDQIYDSVEQHRTCWLTVCGIAQILGACKRCRPSEWT